MNRLNKNVLNGFVQQAVSHNKFLEEQEMWKKRDESLEKPKTSKESYEEDSKRKKKRLNEAKKNSTI